MTSNRGKVPATVRSIAGDVELAEPIPVAYLAGILLLAVILRILLFSGYVGGDDSAYIARAFVFSQGDFTPPDTHWGTRSLLVLTTAISFSLFGVNRFAVALLPFLLSVSTVFLTFHLGRLLLDARVGMLAAFLVAIFPMEVIFASHLFPYAFLSFFSALTLYLFCRAEQTSYNWLYFVMGVVIGLAYLSRITALFAGLFFLCYAIYKRRIPTGYAYAAGGFLLIFLAEMAYFFAVAGNPFHRFSTLFDRPTSVAPEIIAATGSSIDFGWWLEPFIRPITEQEIGLYFLLLWPILFWQLLRERPRGVTLLLLWIIPIFLYTTYGTMSVSDYSPLRRLPRYLAPIIIPCLILIAWQITQLRSRRFKVAALVTLVVSSILSYIVDGSPSATKREREISAYIDQHLTTRFIVPRPLYFDVAFYQAFRQPDSMVLYEVPNDRSHTLRRIRTVAPSTVSVRLEALECGDQIFTRPGYLDRNEIPATAQLIGEFAEPDRLILKFLTDPRALTIISLVRDPKRFLDLTRLPNRRKVEVYEQMCPS